MERKKGSGGVEENLQEVEDGEGPDKEACHELAKNWHEKEEADANDIAIEEDTDRGNFEGDGASEEGLEEPAENGGNVLVPVVLQHLDAAEAQAGQEAAQQVGGVAVVTEGGEGGAVEDHHGHGQRLVVLEGNLLDGTARKLRQVPGDPDGEPTKPDNKDDGGEGRSNHLPRRRSACYGLQLRQDHQTDHIVNNGSGGDELASGAGEGAHGLEDLNRNSRAGRGEDAANGQGRDERVTKGKGESQTNSNGQEAP